MNDLTHDLIDNLLDNEKEICISIYQPTHRFGQEVAQGKDAIVLKNHLKEVERELDNKGLNQSEKDNLLNPISDLLDNTEFWNHQKEGLALLASEDGLVKIKLDEDPGNYSSVANRYYVVPLITQLQTDNNYLILALDIKNIRLFNAGRVHIEDISETIEDFPPNFRDVIGHDYEPATLQYRGQQEAQGNAMYHGQGNLEIDHKKEVKEYFRKVNKQILSYLREQDLPMILIGQDYLIPLYKEVNEYKNITKEVVTFHPANIEDREIQTKTWDKIQSIVLKEENEMIKKWEEWQGTDKTSTQIKEILNSAYQGRVEGLFVNLEQNVLGQFDPETAKVTISENGNGESLINLAAALTYQKGGKVFTLTSDDGSDFIEPVHAIYRF